MQATEINTEAPTVTEPTQPRHCPACGVEIEIDAPKTRVYCHAKACKAARAVASSQRSRARQPQKIDAFVAALERAAVRADRLGGLVTLSAEERDQLVEASKRLTAATRKLAAVPKA